MLFGIIRQPDAGCQHRAIFQRYQRVLDEAHDAWKSRHNHRDPQLECDYTTAEAVTALDR